MPSVTTSLPAGKRKACEAETDADINEHSDRNTQEIGTEASDQVGPPLKKVYRTCAGACPSSRSAAVTTESWGQDSVGERIVSIDTSRADTARVKMDSEDEILTDADGFSGDEDGFLETQGSDVDSMEEGLFYDIFFFLMTPAVL